MENEKYQLAFELAFLDMPEQFSSKMFCTKLREIGTEERAIKSGMANEFLKSHCINNSDRGWSKIHGQEKVQQEQPQTSKKGSLLKDLFSDVMNDEEEEIKKAIEILKKAGYKVLKPETTFKEI